MVWCALDGDADMGKTLHAGAGARRRRRHRHRRQVGHPRHARAPTARRSRSPASACPRDATLGGPGAAVQVGVVESFALGYAAVYVGIAESALDFAVDYAKKARRQAGEHRGRAGSRPCSATSASSRASRRRAAGADRLGRRWDGGRDRASAARSRTAPSTSPPRSGCEVTSRVIQVVGGRGAYKDFPGRARLPRPAHVHADAADGRSHARRRSARARSGSRTACSRPSRGSRKPPDAPRTRGRSPRAAPADPP